MIKAFVKQGLYPLIKSRPDFLIIGAQKAGTTSLYQYLTQHPQITGNKSWKEIRYFDLPENYSKGMAWYLGNFPTKWEKQDRLTFDASPSYLYFKHIPELIQQDLGSIKMIAILRNPTERAYSAWQMYHSFADNAHQNLREIADSRTFSEAIQDELARKIAAYPYDYVGRGKYVEQLENYYQYFDRSNILVLSFDQLRKDACSILQEICEFLNIRAFPQDAVRQLQKEKHNVGKYQQSDGDRATVEQLRNYFLPYNEKLYQLLGEIYPW
ncbi:MAG: hypothetical protein Kow00121_26480 [Elainellaceae cyanobacterium]